LKGLFEIRSDPSTPPIDCAAEASRPADHDDQACGSIQDGNISRDA
jgi:hypothetical protein